MRDQEAALNELPLTGDEKEGIKSLWPNDFMYRIWDIIALHENIQVRSDLESTSVESTDRWAERLRRAVNKLLYSSSGGSEDICQTAMPEVLQQYTKIIRGF